MPSRRRRDPRLRDFFATRSSLMRAVLATAAKVVDHDVSLLVTGESGSGKDYLANAIHASGARRNEPFVHVDCASIPADLFESELFGYEQGTFTGATSRKLGRLEAAGRGVVYLDDVAALTPPMQAKLLRVLEDRSWSRLGGHRPLTLHARVIASLPYAPAALISSGVLRRDLFYRLNVVTVELPPLRDRREDIPILARLFLKMQRRRAVKTLSDEVLHALASYSWPGNVRELRNVIERAALIEDSSAITTASLPAWGGADLVQQASAARWTLAELEAHYIEDVLRATSDNYSQAARILGINRKTLLEKRRRYAIGEEPER